MVFESHRVESELGTPVFISLKTGPMHCSHLSLLFINMRALSPISLARGPNPAPIAAAIWPGRGLLAPDPPFLVLPSVRVRLRYAC